MAKSVSLNDAESADLMARVTGQKKTAPGMNVPPPVGGTGLRGKPPIPRNVPVFTPDIEKLTADERNDLLKIGWKPGEPITGNVGDLIAEVSRNNDIEKEAELTRLTSGKATAVNFDPVDESTLSPEQQAEIRRRMQETMDAAKVSRQKKEELESTSGMSDSVRNALKVAQAPTGLEIEDDRNEPTKAGTAPSDTGVTSGHPGNCPHCGWDQSVTDDTTTTPGDKQALLQSIIGEKCFSKDYPLFGGNVTVTFRSLTAQEIDKIYMQVYHERKIGEIPTDMDFMERVNRYRLYLQLLSVRSGSYHHEFPEGFTPDTNSTATTFYTLPDNLPEGETGLRAVEKHITKTALKTEIMMYTVTNEARRFNRLVAKLMAMADHPDFWQATGG